MLEKIDLPQDVRELLRPYEEVKDDDKSESPLSKKKEYQQGKYTPISNELNLPSENLKFNNILDQSSKLVLKENRYFDLNMKKRRCR
jgi:hypothetical protein